MQMPERLPLLPCLCLIVALCVPAPATGAQENAPLIDAVDRIAAIRAGKIEPEAGPTLATASTACAALTDFVGRPLQRLLERSYEGLDANQSRVQALLSTSAGFERFLEHARRALRAGGLESSAARALATTLQRTYQPRGGMIASYSMNLHASEITTAVCRVVDRLQDGATADARARRRIDSAVTVLQGLAVVAALNPPPDAGRAPAAHIAGAAAATGSVLIAHAYRSMF